MMSFISITLFLLFSFSFGLGLTFFLKNSSNFFERNIMRFGIGIGVIPILGAVLNLFRIPLHWVVYSCLSILCLLLGLWKSKKDGFKFPEIKATKSNIYVGIVLVLFVILFVVMYKGAFAYPWFEDGDPYDHAVAANLIAYQNTFSKPEGLYISHYTEPYVQGFPILIGLMRQLSDSIVWTLKFYNVLLVALSIPFFYFFIKRFTGNIDIALLSTIALTAIPSFQSHFIFAETLALMLFFPAFYCIEMAKDDLKWIIPAIVITSSIMISQQLSAFNFGMFFIIYFVCSFIFWIRSSKEIRKSNKNYIKTLFFIGILGLILSCIFFIPVFKKYSLDTIKFQYTLTEEIDPAHKEFWQYSDTHAIKYYTLQDFITAPLSNKTDNPTGFGWILFTLTIIGLAYCIFAFKQLPQRCNLLIAFIWMIFSFLMVMGDRLPFRILPNRNWAFLSISIVIFVGIGLLFFPSLFDTFIKAKYVKYIVLGIILVGIFFTSFWPKVLINTSQWAPHVFRDVDELKGYLWIKDNLPKNSFIFDFCGRDYKIMASDMMSPVWDERLYTLRYIPINKNYDWDEKIFEYMNDTRLSPMMNLAPKDLSSSLSWLSIQYFIITSECSVKFGENETNKRITELMSNFKIIYSSNSIVVFQLNRNI